MNKIITYYNKESLVEKIKDTTGYKVAVTTIWLWEKKGYLTPSGYMANGARLVPVYTDKELLFLCKKISSAIDKAKAKGSLKISVFR